MGNILSIDNLSIKLKQRTLMQNVSFDIGQGEVVLLSGENVNGKSSILKVTMRLETEGKKIEGRITHYSFGDILSLSDDEV